MKNIFFSIEKIFIIKNFFYRIFYKIIFIILGQTIISIILIIFIINKKHQILYQKKYNSIFFLKNSNEIYHWINASLNSIYNHDDYNKNFFNTTKNYFTSTGWNKFQEAQRLSGNTFFLQKHHLSSHAIISKKIFITILIKKNIWYIRIPIIIIYQNKNKFLKEKVFIIMKCKIISYKKKIFFKIQNFISHTKN